MAGRVGAVHRRAFRAAPRADFAVTAIRLQSLTPSRLRRCALHLPSGDRRKAHPRRVALGAPGTPPNRLAPDRPGRRPLPHILFLRHGFQLLPHLREKLLGLLCVVASVGQRQ